MSNENTEEIIDVIVPIEPKCGQSSFSSPRVKLQRQQLSSPSPPPPPPPFKSQYPPLNAISDCDLYHLLSNKNDSSHLNDDIYLKIGKLKDIKLNANTEGTDTRYRFIFKNLTRGVFINITNNDEETVNNLENKNYFFIEKSISSGGKRKSRRKNSKKRRKGRKTLNLCR